MVPRRVIGFPPAGLIEEVGVGLLVGPLEDFLTGVDLLPAPDGPKRASRLVAAFRL